MNKDDVVKFVRSELASGAGKSGSELTQALKNRFPQWSPSQFDYKTFREFVADNLPGIGRVGSKGLDPIYGVLNPTSSRASQEAPLSVWRVWASPSSPYLLDLDVIEGVLTAVEGSAAAASGVLRISPPGDEDHRQIARDFLPLHLPGDAVELDSIISPNPQWWQRWMKEMKKRGLTGMWGHFRFVRLVALFEDRLHDAGIQEAARDKAVIQLRGAAGGAGVAAADKAPGAAAKLSSISQLRQVAIGAIELMDERQLRELSLPLGLIVDALKRPVP